MRRLAGASRQVPKSYLVGTFTSCKVEKRVIASGGFADIRKGQLKGKNVAVKTIRISLEDEEKIGPIHEVRDMACYPHLWLLIKAKHHMQAFCKECVVWMNMSHPNIHQLTAVKIKPRAGEFSMISGMMKNGNIINYTKKNRANRISLVRVSIIAALLGSDC